MLCLLFFVALMGGEQSGITEENIHLQSLLFILGGTARYAGVLPSPVGPGSLWKI